jgi:hypothetical protein
MHNHLVEPGSRGTKSHLTDLGGFCTNFIIFRMMKNVLNFFFKENGFFGGLFKKN